MSLPGASTPSPFQSHQPDLSRLCRLTSGDRSAPGDDLAQNRTTYGALRPTLIQNCTHTTHSFLSCGFGAVSRRAATKQAGTASRCRGALCTCRAHRLPTTRRPEPCTVRRSSSAQWQLQVAGRLGIGLQDLVVGSMYSCPTLTRARDLDCSNLTNQP